MNNVSLIGNLTRDPEIRYSQGERQTAIATFTIAVNRKYKREGEPDADFLRCVAFGKVAELIEKYFSKGNKIGLRGWIRTGSYQNKDGVTVYTTDISVEDIYFVESRNQASNPAPQSNNADFTELPDGMMDGLPFN